MRFTQLVSRARYALLIVPLFGLLTSIQVGCGVSEPDGLGNIDADMSTGHNPYGYGYGSYGYGSDGYAGYGSYGYGD